jgi:hypothetical protein
MDKKTKTWLSIALSILLLIGLLGLAVVGGGIYFVYSHVNSEPASQADARDRFAQARQQLAGKPPLVEIQEGREPIVHRPPATAQAARLQHLRVLAYDPDDGRVTEVDIPFWLVRMMPSGRFSFRDNNIELDADDLRVTVADLERHGPGLVLDHEGQRGGRVIAWTE